MEYEEFEKIIVVLKDSFKRVGALSDVTDCDLFVDLTGPLVDQLVDLLAHVFEDDLSWISYWIFDLNFGENYVPGMVMTNGHNVPLKTIEDLWNLL